MKRTKVLVLGATGMLGHEVASYFRALPRYEVSATYRKAIAGYTENGPYFDALTSTFDSLGG